MVTSSCDLDFCQCLFSSFCLAFNLTFFSPLATKALFQNTFSKHHYDFKVKIHIARTATHQDKNALVRLQNQRTTAHSLRALWQWQIWANPPPSLCMNESVDQHWRNTLISELSEINVKPMVSGSARGDYLSDRLERRWRVKPNKRTTQIIATQNFRTKRKSAEE